MRLEIRDIEIVLFQNKIMTMTREDRQPAAEKDTTLGQKRYGGIRS